MARTYYSLLVRVNGTWSVDFGDFDKAVVGEEMRDRRYAYPPVRARDMKIVSHPDTVTNPLVIAGLAQ